MTGEFEVLRGGLWVTILRSAIRYCRPFELESEHDEEWDITVAALTTVGLDSGERLVVRMPYNDFREWWLAGLETGK